MSKNSKWLKLGVTLVAGGMLLSNGCLGAFWQGLTNTGWPTGNRWLNIAIDIIKEDIFM